MELAILLTKLGLTKYESQVYLSLAKLGPSTVRDLVEDNTVPRNKTYEALKRLEKQDRIASLPGTPISYKIINEQVLEDEINEMQTSIKELTKLIESPKMTTPNDLFWVIKGKTAIEQKLAIEDAKAKKEIFACHTFTHVLYKNIRTIKEAVNKGVDVRFICPFDENKIPHYNIWLRAGVKLRVFNKELFGPEFPRIAIFDEKQARLTIGHPEIKEFKDVVTLWTKSPTFAKMFRNYFLYMWEESNPINKYIHQKIKK